MKQSLISAMAPQTPGQVPQQSAMKPTSLRSGVAREALERYNYSASAFAKWRSEMKQFFRAYATDPWPVAEKNKLEDEKRINAVFSLCTKIINTVVGQDLGDRKEARFAAINDDPESGFIADMFTRLTRIVFQKSDGHRVDSNVYQDMLICGYGWGSVYVDNTRRQQQIRVRQIEPWLVYPDPDATADCLSDGEYICVEHWLTESQCKMRWPGRDWSMAGDPAIRVALSQTPRVVSADAYFDADAADLNVQSRITRRENGVKVIEYQRYVYERWAEFDDGSGESQFLPEAQYRAMIRRMQGEVDEEGQNLNDPVSGSIRFMRRVRRAFVVVGESGGGDLLEDEELELDEFTYKCATGLREKDPSAGRVYHFGLMKLAYDPQLWASRGISLMLEILGRQSKGGYLIEEEAVDDMNDFEQRSAIPGSNIIVKAGAMDKIRERPVQSLPAAYGDLFSMMVDAMGKTTNVGDFLTGAATSERSNVLISNLQNQQISALNSFTDQMSAYRMQIGQLLAKVIQATWTAPAMDKLLGNPMVEGITSQTDPATGEEQQIASAGQILKQVDILDYRCQADTTSASPTSKQAFWEALTDAGLMGQIMEKAPQAVPEILPLFFEQSPLPTEIAQKISTKLRDALRQPQLEEEMGRYQRMAPEDQQQLLIQALQQMDPTEAQGLIAQALPQEEQQEGEQPAEAPVQ